MGSIARMDRCDRYCNEFAEVAATSLLIKSKCVLRGALGFDETREVVMFYMTIRDKDKKEHLVACPFVVFDPEGRAVDEMELTACRLGLKPSEVKRRFKKAKLL